MSRIDAIVGKTVEGAVFLQCELVSLYFSDGSVLYIYQPSQTGDLKLTLVGESEKDITIMADDEEV